MNDASNPLLINIDTQLHTKKWIIWISDFEGIIERARRDKVVYEYRMLVIPVSFNEYGKELLGRSQHLVSKGWVAVSNVEHKELVTQKRMVRFKDNGNLDKDET
jgi:hypothetical protein